MDDPGTHKSQHAATASAPPRSSVFHSAIVLLLATLALVAFICMLGDLRRKNNAITRTRWHADAFARRVAGTDVLPLNLEPDVPPELRNQIIQVEWLPRDAARYLRSSQRRVIVAYTRPLPRVLGSNGRAVVFFQDGRFDVEWLTLSRFDGLFAAQQEEIQRLAAAAAEEGDPADGP